MLCPIGCTIYKEEVKYDTKHSVATPQYNFVTLEDLRTYAYLEVDNTVNI